MQPYIEQLTSIQKRLGAVAQGLDELRNAVEKDRYALSVQKNVWNKLVAGVASGSNQR